MSSRGFPPTACSWDPPDSAPPLPVITGSHVLAGKRENVVEKRTVFLAKGVSRLLVLALWERCVGIQVMTDVRAASLHQVPRKLAPNTQTFRAIKVGG